MISSRVVAQKSIGTLAACAALVAASPATLAEPVPGTEWTTKEAHVAAYGREGMIVRDYKVWFEDGLMVRVCAENTDAAFKVGTEARNKMMVLSA